MIPVHSGDSEDAGGTPFGVQVLAFFCGLVVAFMGQKSMRQDVVRIKAMTHLESYLETPGHFLKVAVRRDSSGGADDYYPDLLFEYFIDGKSVWGWQLSYEQEPRPKAYWESRLGAYHVGELVNVYYDSGKPKDSIIEKKHDSMYRTWMKLLLGAGFFAIGAVLFLLPLGNFLRSLSKR